jgi:hypothetical protein
VQRHPGLRKNHVEGIRKIKEKNSLGRKKGKAGRGFDRMEEKKKVEEEQGDSGKEF